MTVLENANTKGRKVTIVLPNEFGAFVPQAVTHENILEAPSFRGRLHFEIM